ncbi:hypothetical protein [Caldisericum exile]|uniref:Uncharacterized protein n=1 Tax=Caldisericum exile (strain DSM 21853 / NBRC 104410 / AZM16c01) TaxID=511051 RepID=A0A7U6JFA2_CALEA|nr:hypothetical protein [Caldisericum exile]BAL80209.1 hypothetical protein CSE_00830 [Caldisericum exile AZM16c01]
MRSYEDFYKKVISLQHLKTDSFEVEPLQPMFGGCQYIFTEIDISKIRNTNIQELSNDSLKKYYYSSFVPLFYFGKIDAKNYFSKKYNLFPNVKLNGTEGFSGAFFERFYNRPKHILAMIFLQYTPEIKGNRFITSIVPLDFAVNGVVDNPQNELFKSEIIKHFGNIQTNISENITVYSSDNLIATIYLITPKNNSKSISLTPSTSVLNLLKSIEEIITQ